MLAQFSNYLGRFFTSCDIHYASYIEPGVSFPHGRGVVVGKGVRVEQRCSLFQGVTLGALEGQEGAPHLLEGVNVYPNSVLAGQIEIGEFCRIGPNVYLTESQPSHTRALPSRAHIIKNNFMYDFDKAIRRVPDFPKPGILFYDITSLLESPDAMLAIQEEMDRLIDPDSYDALLGVDSRGFIFSSIAAYRLKKPLYLARKPGKLPNETISQSYDLEYGSAALEIQKVDLKKGGRWLVVDDLIATGGTLEATCSMLESEGVNVAGIFSIVGLPFLGYAEKLSKYKVHTLVDYDSE